MQWVAVILAALKLFGALVERAGATRSADETKAAALGRILNEALSIVDTAKAARAAAAKRDATDDGLQQSDGFRRD